MRTMLFSPEIHQKAADVKILGGDEAENPFILIDSFGGAKSFNLTGKCNLSVVLNQKLVIGWELLQQSTLRASIDPALGTVVCLLVSDITGSHHTHIITTMLLSAP